MRAATTLALSLILLASPAHAANREPHVVGGAPTAKGQFPFVVRTYAPSGTCTGSLIRDNWVLTAAHCGDDGPPTQVLIGDAESFKDGPTHIVTKLNVAEWIAHPGYDPLTNANDIALIKLAGNASQVPPRENGAVQYVPSTIGLATTPTSTANSIGKVRLVGFGRIDNPTLPGIPGFVIDNPGFVYHAADLPTLPLANCESLYQSDLNPTGQLCYGGYPGDCDGDSGGPVFIASSGNFTQLGVVSFGFAACGAGPSVATWVPGYTSWVSEQIDGTAAPSPIELGWELPQSVADGVASGIANIQGWTFSRAGTITSVRVERNGVPFINPPCCSERGDVQNAIPGAPLQTGFAAVINWGNLGNSTTNLTLVVRDSAGNERRETRTVKSVQYMNGVPFVTGLAFTPSTSCSLLNQGFECSGLSFQQGTCTGDITFGWQQGKQTFEVIEGCH